MDNIDRREAQANIFGSFFLISNKLQAIGDDYLDDLTTKQWFLIAAMSKFFNNYNPSLSEVAEVTGTSRQNVKQLALKLKEKGYLNIDKDPKDSRTLRLSFTEKVNEYAKRTEEKDLQFMDLLFKGIDDNELIKIFNGLNKFIENLKLVK